MSLFSSILHMCDYCSALDKSKQAIHKQKYQTFCIHVCKNDLNGVFLALTFGHKISAPRCGLIRKLTEGSVAVLSPVCL